MKKVGGGRDFSGVRPLREAQVEVSPILPILFYAIFKPLHLKVAPYSIYEHPRYRHSIERELGKETLLIYLLVPVEI